MASARSHLRQPVPRFDGFPYISTRVIPALYHIILLPAGEVEAELFRLTRQQSLANQLSSCLVLASDRAIYCEPDGRTVLSNEPLHVASTVSNESGAGAGVLSTNDQVSSVRKWLSRV